MITPSQKVNKSYTFFYKKVRGAFWEDDEIIATTFLLSQTQDKSEEEQVIEELENYADAQNKKLYITNFCSRSLLDIMDERGYLTDNMRFKSQKRTWQINIRYYTPKIPTKNSLLPLEPFLGYNGVKK